MCLADEQADGPSQILVIDHDPHILSQVRRILGQHNYELLTATSGKAGLRLFQEENPSVVLLDLQLTDVDGLKLLGQMKEKRLYIPVIIMAPPSATTAVAAMRQGADDYLSEPIIPEELLEQVQHNLEKGLQARQQFELTEQLQHQLARLLSLQEVAREASLAVDLYHILQRALDQTLKALGLNAAIVFVSENNDLVPLSHRGLPRAIASTLTRRRLSWNDEALSPFHEITQATRTRSERQQGGPLSQAVGYTFTAIVPLLAQGRLWGILEVAGKKTPDNLQRDLETLTSLGQQIALSVSNVRLQETAAIHVRELALLNEACLALTSDLDLEQILTTIMLRTSDVIGVETGSLLMADEDIGELVFRIALGEVSGRVLSQRVPPGEGIAGWVYQQGVSVLTTDVHQDPRYYPDIDQHSGFQTRSILCVPLKIREERFGVIELVNKISGEFTSDDQRVLESVAALTATAIAQSRMQEWTTSFVLVDPLTRLPNHRFLQEALEREAARCRRYERICSLLIMGLDRRIMLSETCWRQLATAMKKELRGADLLCRHREGNLVFILPETGPQGGQTLIGRLRSSLLVCEMPDTSGENLIEYTRFALTCYPEDIEDPKDLLGKAEEALLQAWQE